MRHRGAMPAGAVEAEDLRPLFDGTGPFATVLLNTDPADANPGLRWSQRWRTVRRELERAGADAGSLAHLDEASDRAYQRGDTFYAVADAARLWISESWGAPSRHEMTRVAPLPSLAPLLAQRQREVPHVVALVDREGADIVTIERGGTAHDESISGETGPVIRKSAPGGWSQKRYQSRAEESWARTAHETAEAIVAEADANDAELVLLAGDVREVQLVRDALPRQILEITHVVPGGRAAGTDERARQHEMERLVGTAVADATVALLRKLREELGQHDRAVAGVADTIDALRKAQVEVLLLHDDPGDERLAWFGSAPTAIGLDSATVGVDEGPAREGRLPDVALRSAIGTGAAVRVVPTVDAIPDGLGAILRWAHDGNALEPES